MFDRFPVLWTRPPESLEIYSFIGQVMISDPVRKPCKRNCQHSIWNTQHSMRRIKVCIFWTSGKGMAEIQINDQWPMIPSISLFIETWTGHKYLGSEGFLSGQYHFEVLYSLGMEAPHTSTAPLAPLLSSISLWCFMYIHLGTVGKCCPKFSHH